MQCIMLRFISYLLFYQILPILCVYSAGRVPRRHDAIRVLTPATRTFYHWTGASSINVPKPSPATRVFYVTTSVKDVAYRTYIAAT
jgi:hypothetical protein